jgi:hypothetical protein
MYQVVVVEGKIVFHWSTYILQFRSKELAIFYSCLGIFHAGTDVLYFMADSIIPKCSYLGIHQPKGKRDIGRRKREWKRQF